MIRPASRRQSIPPIPPKVPDYTPPAVGLPLTDPQLDDSRAFLEVGHGCRFHYVILFSDRCSAGDMSANADFAAPVFLKFGIAVRIGPLVSARLVDFELDQRPLVRWVGG